MTGRAEQSAQRYYDDNCVCCSESLTKEIFVAGYRKAEKDFLEVLGRWLEHAERGMKVGATAYHQGKVALIVDLQDWINGTG